jgi:hypothetical protein
MQAHVQIEISLRQLESQVKQIDEAYRSLEITGVHSQTTQVLLERAERLQSSLSLIIQQWQLHHDWGSLISGSRGSSQRFKQDPCYAGLLTQEALRQASQFDELNNVFIPT